MLEQKNIHPNVDFPCGMTYFTLGIPVPQYTPIFVASRITGWAAHIMEQHANNRLIRPRAAYIGPGAAEVERNLTPDGLRLEDLDPGGLNSRTYRSSRSPPPRDLSGAMR